MWLRNLSLSAATDAGLETCISPDVDILTSYYPNLTGFERLLHVNAITQT